VHLVKNLLKCAQQQRMNDTFQAAKIGWKRRRQPLNRRTWIFDEWLQSWPCWILLNSLVAAALRET